MIIASHRARHYVIDCVAILPTMLASVIIAPQYALPYLSPASGAATFLETTHCDSL